MKATTYLFVLILSLSLVSSATVVEVSQPEPAPATFFDDLFGFLFTGLFWTVTLGLALIVGIIVLGFFLLRWIIQYVKQRNDIFYLVKRDRMKLAKIHRRYPSKHWWKVHKNTPIRLVKQDGDDIIVSKPIAYHRGDYETHEGNLIMSMNLAGKKKFFIFPETDLLIVPNRDKVVVKQRDPKTFEEKEITMDNLPSAKKIIKFNENEILVYADSLSKTGLFYIPVIKDRNGKTIDIALPVFATLKSVAMEDYMYNQASEFGVLAKKAMDINPNIRATQKVQDTNQNVEVQREG